MLGVVQFSGTTSRRRKLFFRLCCKQTLRRLQVLSPFTICVSRIWLYFLPSGAVSVNVVILMDNHRALKCFVLLPSPYILLAEKQTAAPQNEMPCVDVAHVQRRQCEWCVNGCRLEWLAWTTPLFPNDSNFWMKPIGIFQLTRLHEALNQIRVLHPDVTKFNLGAPFIPIICVHVNIAVDWLIEILHWFRPVRYVHEEKQ